MKNLTTKLIVAAGATAVSSVSFAQASGVDVTSTVTSITGVISSVVAIGGAVLSVVVVAWGYKTVKSFMGR